VCWCCRCAQCDAVLTNFSSLLSMAFSLPANEDFAAEQLEAEKRPGIRLFSVGTSVGKLQNGESGPQPDLRWVDQQWTKASAASVGGCNPTLDARCMTRTDKGLLLNCSGATNRLSTCSEFGYFSALCWHFGKKIYDANDGKVPVGLVSSNWGGTPLEDWATADAFKACGGFKPEPRGTCRTAVPARGGNGELWNSMLAPLAHGPTQLSGMLWWQGEANTKGLHCAKSYQCMFKAMISGWRAAFRQPEAFFGFVQLSTWCPVGEHGLGLAQFREAQMAAAKLPNVGWATAADWGAGCDIHPPMKAPVAARLANSAIALLSQYAPLRAKLNLTTAGAWRSPTFNASRAVPTADGRAVVAIALNDAAELRLIHPRNYRGMILNGSTTTAGYSTGPPTNCTFLSRLSPNTCAWAAVEIDGVHWHNASVSVDASGRGLLLTTLARVPGSGTRAGLVGGAKVTGAAYGYGPIPLLSVETVAGGLPVLPWNTSSEL